MAIKYSDARCKECKIMPLCNRGCSTVKLENGHLDKQCKKASDYLYIISNAFINSILHQNITIIKDNLKCQSLVIGKLLTI